MDMEYFITIMEVFIKVYGTMITDMNMEFLLVKMGIDIRGCGKMEKNMVRQK